MESVNEDTKSDFKKPILIGKIGRLPRKVVKVVEQRAEASEGVVEESEAESPEAPKNLNSPAQQAAENAIPLPYKEPTWSGLPQSPSKDYYFEVLKSGSIIENINLMEKAFWVFGRLANSDISMAHPTISRYHAILQYKNEDSEDQARGFYLYDLSSTHGTFLNKLRLKPRTYMRVQVGHMIKLGCSSRTFIFNGPDEDAEEVSELTVTELKKQRAEELLRREREIEEAKIKAEEEAEAKRKRDEERGVDWGMGEDADEENDMVENPYAQTNNEELYVDDPKKALRGFMEREGLDLEYDCSEQGMGQFLCKVVLPIDDDKGRPLVAEVLHKGKKKEAVVQCAMEACRILDRHGLLRQATHESRKRKAKNWEDNDYYDSDDDTFLDRTGTIEKKRENRMKAKLPQQPETYQSLLEKETTISKQISDIENQLEQIRAAPKKTENDDEDSLDSYMKELKTPQLDKQKITKLKTDLSRLKQEHSSILKLVNIARPADLPPLTPQNTQTKKLPLFGKRIKVKVQKPLREEVKTKEVIDEVESEEEEEKEIITEKVVETVEITKVAVSEVKESNSINNEKVSCPVDPQVLKQETERNEEKKRKKNLRRIQHRQEKNENERLKGYEEDAKKEDYNMWVPPEGQTGDGRTSLNDKLGY